MLRLLAIFIVWLGLMSSPLEAGTSMSHDKMEPIAKNGLILDSVSYWPFFGSINFHYPDDVLWGFYPKDASPQSVKCAEESYEKLRGFIDNVPHSMRQLLKLDISRQLYLWVNDYSQANVHRIVRPSNFWFWSSKGEKPYRNGHWVWETTLKQDFSCELPTDQQIFVQLNKAWECLHNNRCDSGYE